MELYYKDLISEDALLEKLVEDLTWVVQGADALLEGTGAPISDELRNELKPRLARLKSTCARAKAQALAGARATDRLMRQHPYALVGLAFGGGLLAGMLVSRRRST